jgi:hypothetical protein
MQTLPEIQVQPVDVTVTEPEAASFSVEASGDGPLSYQWRRDGVMIAGATGETYTLDPTSVADSGAQFDVVVSNPYGSVTSQAATLTVNAAPQPPSIITQPTDVTVTEPTAATFTVTASGDQPLSYQWRRDGVAIAGATASTYTLDPTTTTDSGAQFDVFVSNAHGSVTSQAATLTVLPGSNTPPIAVDDAYAVVQGGTIDTVADGIPGVLANDDDADNDPLTAMLVDDVVNGVLTFNSDGSFTYAHSGDAGVSLPLSPGAGNSLTEYGVATAIDGDTLVVGANSKEAAGNYSGAAYVFVRSDARWELEAKLIPDDAAALQFFGWSVDIDDDTIVVAAPGDSRNGLYSGAAYVFTRNGSTWNQQAKLKAQDPAARDEFAVSVAIDGDTIVVGSYLDDDSAMDSGSVYVFARNGTSWSQQAKLNASTPSVQAWFGLAVDIAGDTILAGAIQDDATVIDAGATYVFVRNGTTWSEQALLTASDAATDDAFGFAVAVQGDTAVIGANGFENTTGFAGAVYVYERNGTVWSQQQKLTPVDATGANGLFGFGVSIGFDGDTILVGTNGDDAMGVNTGSVYVFQQDGTGWMQQDKLFSLNPATGAEFGVVAAVDGDYMAIGANSGKFNSIPDKGAGSAYVYQIGGTLTDSFTYMVNDGTEDGNTATVLISLDSGSANGNQVEWRRP